MISAMRASRPRRRKSKHPLVLPLFPAINFEPALPWQLLAAFTVCGLAVTIFAAARTPRNRVATALLSVVSMALVLAVLANPVERGDLAAAVPSGTQVVLLDTSKSMSLGAPEPRWREGLAWAKPLLDEKDPSLRTRLVTFDSTCDLSGRPPTEAAGASTRLAQAIERVLAQSGEAPPVHFIVISDGVFEDAPEITRALARLRERQIVVSTRMAGSEALAPNLFIREIEAPRFAPTESQVPVRLSIGAAGLPPETRASLRLRGEDGRVIEERAFELGATSSAIELTLPFGLRAERFTAQLSSAPGELSDGDNTVTFRIEPLNPKIRVFLAEGSQGWLPIGDAQLATARFFPAAFQRTGEIECDLFQMPEQDKRGQPLYYVSGFDDADVAILDRTRTIPSDRDGWWRYDVIIISDIDRQMLLPHMETVRQLVAERGGGFLMNGGNHSFDTGYYDQTIWEKLIPVDCLQFGFGHGGRPAEVQFPAAARSHPILQFTASPALNERILDCHPRFRGYHDIRRVKPGATTLATVASNGAPLVAVQDYGRGRTMAFLADPAGGWGVEYSGRWGPALLAEHGGDEAPGERALIEDPALAVNEFYNRFWVNSMRWLAAHSVRRQERALLGRVATATARPAEMLSVSAELQTGEAADGLPNWSVGVRVDGPGGERVPLRYDRARGEFLGEIAAPSGNTASELTLRFDATAGERSFVDAVTVPLVRIERELERTKPDAQFMADIARAGGGRVLSNPAEAREVSAAALKSAGERRLTYARPRWDRAWFWALFLAVAGAKWWLWRQSRSAARADLDAPTTPVRAPGRTPVEVAVSCFLVAMLSAAAKAEEAPAVTKAARVCLIFGHPGDDAHREKYRALRMQMAATLQTRFALAPGALTVFDSAGSAAEPPPRDHLLAGLRENVAAATPDAATWLIFIGHANSTRTGASFNLPGPDLTETELRNALEQTPPRGPLVFICTQAASGRWVRAIAGEQRFIFAATRSYEQDNETELPAVLASVLAGKGADANGDGVVSLLEIFEQCRTGVQDAFTSRGFLQMETPMLEANGDGRPTARPAPEDAEAAARIGLALAPVPAAPTPTAPAP